MEEKNIKNIYLGLQVEFDKKQRRINKFFARTFLNYITKIMLIIFCMATIIYSFATKSDLLLDIFLIVDSILFIKVDLLSQRGFNPIGAWGRYRAFELTAMQVSQHPTVSTDQIQKEYSKRETILKRYFHGMIKQYIWVIILQIIALISFATSLNRVALALFVIIIALSLLNIWLRNVFYELKVNVKIVPKPEDK